MRKAIRTIGVATLIIGSVAALSPAYAQKEKKPPAQSDMMKDGGMDGMMGMMEQMNKMMGALQQDDGERDEWHRQENANGVSSHP